MVRGRGRLVRRVALAFVGACAALVAFAGPASAHAQLQETDPPNGVRLQSAPRQVTLRFDEAVEVSLGSIRVYDGSGKRIDSGRVEHPGGRASEVSSPLPALGDGSYVVTWRVVSADSHPVQGAFTFLVGNAAPAASSDLSARLLSQRGGSQTVGVVFAVNRSLAFASLLVLLGGVLLVAVAWPDGARARSLRRLVSTAWLTLIVTTALAIGLEGAYGGGLGLVDVVKPSVASSVLHTRFGFVYVTRIVLLLAAAPLLGRLFDHWPGAAPASRAHPRWWYACAAPLALALAATPGLGGHASSGMLVPLAIPADTLHVAAASAWIGGLAVLVLCVLPRIRGAELERAVTRFSMIAASSVAVLVATGVFQGWRQVGSVHALTGTTYGRLLIAKTAVVAAILAVATVSRSAVHQRWRAPAAPGGRTRARAVPAAESSPRVVATPSRLGAGRRPAPEAPLQEEATTPAAGRNGDGPGAALLDRDAATARRLQWSVGGEALMAAAVIVLTALLVNAAPARSVASQPRSGTIAGQTLLLDYTFSPARTGPNQIHLYTLTKAGQQQDPVEMTLTMSLPSKGIAPIPVPLQKAGPGHYQSLTFVVPIRGTWQLQALARTSDIDEDAFYGSVKIG